MTRLDRALDELDLRHWFSQYTTVTNQDSPEVRLQDCPKCGKSKNKVYLHIEKRLFHCKHCGFGKGINDICVLMAEISGIHINDLKVELAKTVTPAKPDDEFLAEIRDTLFLKNNETPPEIEPVVVPGYDELKGVLGQKVRHYLKEKRGLTDKEITKFNIGFSIKLRGVSSLFAVVRCLYYYLPVAWQGRSITNKEPRYVSSSSIKNWVWPLDKEYLEDIEQRGFVIVSEGVFDAMAFLRLGLPAVCTFGKQISYEQIKLLKRHGAKQLYFGWDPEAGITGAIKQTEHLFDIYRLNYNPASSYYDKDPGYGLKNDKALEYLRDSFDTATPLQDEEKIKWQIKEKLNRPL